ncbi:TPA: hypothetical protein ACKPYT_004655 [Pseudomonas aeruginosa]|nr:hypothetical protein [Pseudomonas aeruginosa]HBO7974806.1 hypothetical protein [Pseudomonas aeruginosa]HBO8747382.1 hypothetical protein [Pseudomonas aeruginosa]
MNEMNSLEKDALQQLGRTLLHIRMLARGPVTPETGQVIHDLADALHNVPGAIVGTDPSKDELLRAALSDAAGVYQKAGMTEGRA